MAGLSDILSVYREAVASEHATRRDEMQMALAMLEAQD